MTTAQSFIGKYRILGEIASGSFGRVYRGEDTSRQNYPVAIKIMHAAHLANTQERHSFLQEAQLLTMLRHPYIVPVLDVGIENEFPYLIMEYAPNGSLSDRMGGDRPQPLRRPLPVKEAQKILGQVGAALQYAHQQNVIHRDLKPANILFNTRGEALLADFGIATMLATSMKSGTAVGTPYYMAPEQFRGTISKEGDQYALGCIAYQILTGRLPFDAPDFFALGYKHMSEGAIPPTQLNLLIPYQIEAAILRAMAKQRTDRFPDVLAFVTALGAPMPAAALAPASVTFAPTLPPRQEATLPATPQPWLAADEEEENNEDHTLKISRYVEEEYLNAPPDRSVVFPLRQVVQEEEGLDGAARRGAVGPSPYATRAAEVEGQPLAPADALSRLVNASTQTAPLDVLPRIIEGPVVRTPLPGGIGRGAGSYDEEAAPTIITGTHRAGEEDDAIGWAGMGKNLEGGDDAPGYLGGAGMLGGPRGPTSWSMGTPPNPARGPQNKRKRRGMALIATIIALLFVLVGGGGLYAMTSITRPPARPKPPALATANVTITPVQTTLDKTYTIDAVTGTPGASKNQVQARYITASEGSQSKTIAATGSENTSATRATGTLYIQDISGSGESLGAGQGFLDASGKQSVLVISAVTISPGGSVTVEGESGNLGTNGNLSAYYFNYNYCLNSGCSVEIHLENTSALSGGQNASSYTYVSQADMNNAISAANQLQASETSSGQAAVTAQVRSNERMLGSASCSANKTYNQSAGDRANSVTAGVSVSCSAEVYDQQGAQALAASLLEKSLNATPNVALVGQPTTSVTQVSAGSNGTVVLKIAAKGTDVATFTNVQKQTLAKLIAGTTAQEAQDILINQAGVSKAAVTVSGGDGHTLPKDTARITIVVAQA